MVLQVFLFRPRPIRTPSFRSPILLVSPCPSLWFIKQCNNKTPQLALGPGCQICLLQATKCMVFLGRALSSAFIIWDFIMEISCRPDRSNMVLNAVVHEKLEEVDTNKIPGWYLQPSRVLICEYSFFYPAEMEKGRQGGPAILSLVTFYKSSHQPRISNYLSLYKEELISVLFSSLSHQYFSKLLNSRVRFLHLPDEKRQKFVINK